MSTIKTIITMKRLNGKIEIKEIGNNIGYMLKNGNKDILTRLRTANKEATGSEVLEIKVVENFGTSSNIAELRAEYINVNNEGGEGYVPEMEYFESLPQYKEEIMPEKVVIYK
jgi:hypothetical protein